MLYKRAAFWRTFQMLRHPAKLFARTARFIKVMVATDAKLRST
jgi:hypothetical protein